MVLKVNKAERTIIVDPKPTSKTTVVNVVGNIYKADTVAKTRTTPKGNVIRQNGMYM